MRANDVCSPHITGNFKTMHCCCCAGDGVRGGIGVLCDVRNEPKVTNRKEPNTREAQSAAASHPYAPFHLRFTFVVGNTSPTATPPNPPIAASSALGNHLLP
jgi:hypothetical protein